MEIESGSENEQQETLLQTPNRYQRKTKTNDTAALMMYEQEMLNRRLSPRDPPHLPALGANISLSSPGGISSLNSVTSTELTPTSPYRRKKMPILKNSAYSSAPSTPTPGMVSSSSMSVSNMSVKSRTGSVGSSSTRRRRGGSVSGSEGGANRSRRSRRGRDRRRSSSRGRSRSRSRGSVSSRKKVDGGIVIENTHNIFESVQGIPYKYYGEDPFTSGSKIDPNQKTRDYETSTLSSVTALSTDMDGDDGIIQFAPAAPDDDHRVIVVLMDPRSRKFELVHCYYEDDRALVRDILDLIPENATYKPLKKQKYLSLCRPGNGQEFINSFMAKEYNIKNNEILIAIPKGYSGELCVKLAKPILKNSRLLRLIKEADPRWKLQQKSRDLLLNDDSGRKEDNEEEEWKTNIINFIEKYIIPIIQIFSGSKKVKKSDKSTEKKKGYSDPIKEAKRRKRKIRKMTRFTSRLIAVIGLIYYIALYYHIRIMDPLKPGDQIVPMKWRNKCGLLSFFPGYITHCHPMSLRVRNGIISLYDDAADDTRKSLIWEIRGQKLKPGKHEMYIDERGRIRIDDKVTKASYISKNGLDHLTPWPFEVAPPIRNRPFGL